MRYIFLLIQHGPGIGYEEYITSEDDCDSDGEGKGTFKHEGDDGQSVDSGLVLVTL